VHQETEKLVAELTDQAFPAQTTLEPAAELRQRLAKYHALCQTPLALLATGCYWGAPHHTRLWVQCLQRVASTAQSGGGLVYLIKLRSFPALLLMYAAGLAAVASDNYANLAAVLLQPKVNDERGETGPICRHINAMSVIEIDVGRLLPGMAQRQTPVSDYLFGELRSPLREYIPDQNDYQATFDRFEYLLALVYADLRRWTSRGEGWVGPIGCYAWRGQHFQKSTAMSIVAQEIEADGASWPPLKAGLFGGSLEQAKTAKSKFDAFLQTISFW
jgi:hypothetical protein